MKNIFILTLIFILAFSCLYSQSNPLKGVQLYSFNQFEKSSVNDEQYNSILIQKSNSFLSNGEYQLSETIGWDWVNNVWAYSYKHNYYYNELNLKDTVSHDVWNNDNWELFSRFIYEYNNNGRMLKSLFEYLNGTTWVNKELREFSYDEYGNRISETFSEWAGGNWRYIYRNLLEYDDNGNNIFFQNLYWENNDWQNSYRAITTYNENNEQIEHVTNLWDGSAWVNSSKNIHTYDSKRRLSRIEIFNWDGSDWMKSLKYDYIYGPNDSLNTFTGQIWETNQWVNSFRDVKEWDGNNIIQHTDQRWRNEAWVNDFRHNWIYNSDNKPIEHIFKEWEVDTWLNTSRELYTWEKITSTRKLISTQAESYELYQNYPNPFNPSTTIKYGLPTESQVRISIYNLLGEEVKVLLNGVQEAGFHNLEFDASNLSSGIYLYRITASSLETSKEFQSVKKLVLLK